MTYLVVSGKMVFLFLENRVLFFRQKMKDDLPKKQTWKYDISSNAPKRWSDQKKSHWNMTFLVLSGKMVFFPPENMLFFLWMENER